MPAERLVWTYTCASPKQLGYFLFSSDPELLLEQHKDWLAAVEPCLSGSKAWFYFPLYSSHSALDLPCFSAAYAWVAQQVILYSQTVC